ncbi:MAG: hypothetical protein SangKO_098150 [Sandaracinaceae bacterium]
MERPGLQPGTGRLAGCLGVEAPKVERPEGARHPEKPAKRLQSRRKRGAKAMDRSLHSVE